MVEGPPPPPRFTNKFTHCSCQCSANQSNLRFCQTTPQSNAPAQTSSKTSLRARGFFHATAANAAGTEHLVLWRRSGRRRKRGDVHMPRIWTTPANHRAAVPVGAVFVAVDRHKRRCKGSCFLCASAWGEEGR